MRLGAVVGACLLLLACGGSTKSDEQSTGGVGGTSGTGGVGAGGVGAAGTGGSGTGGCALGAKVCPGPTGALACVAADLPEYGCGAVTCDPCSLPWATAICALGTCAVGECDADTADCDGQAENGCEVQLEHDTQHCGSCGTDCTALAPGAYCSNGTCIVLCSGAPGFFDCDGNSLNGCETNTQTDTSNCGFCGIACPSGALCVKGKCSR